MTEDDSLKELISAIEGCNTQEVKRKTGIETFELRPYEFLMSNLVGGIGGLFIRSIFYELNINEHHIFRWRLENKYRQYLVLNHYIPGCMPESISLSGVLDQVNGAGKCRERFENGFFIKATLSERTGKTNTFDRTAEFDDIVQSYKKVDNRQYETWMLQKKLNLKHEFRVHTFNSEVLYGLTFGTQDINSSNYFSDAEAYIKGILEKLPDSIVQGSLIGWDVGLTQEGEYYIIESNFTGFHPVYNRGFQTSGYFQDRPFGPIICAWLNNFVKHKFKISVTSIDPGLFQGTRFYKAFMFYVSLFKKEHFEVAKDRAKDKNLSVIVYFDEDPDGMFSNLIAHFKLVNFAERYYIIARQEHTLRIDSLFGQDNHIQVLGEDTLFTADQYQLIQRLNIGGRKLISCYHAALKLLNNESYVII